MGCLPPRTILKVPLMLMNESELVEVDLANRNNWTTTHPQLELCPAQIVLRTFPSF